MRAAQTSDIVAISPKARVRVERTMAESDPNCTLQLSLAAQAAPSRCAMDRMKPHAKIDKHQPSAQSSWETYQK
jgi:hypothetical protein